MRIMDISLKTKNKNKKNKTKGKLIISYSEFIS